MKNYIPIVDYIRSSAIDKGHAIIGRKIGDVFGITNADVRRFVNEARRNGVPICSCASGYYYSYNSEDIDRTIKHLRGRISKVECAIAGLSGVKTRAF